RCGDVTVRWRRRCGGGADEGVTAVVRGCGVWWCRRRRGSGGSGDGDSGGGSGVTRWWWRVGESGIGDRVDRSKRSLFGFAGKSPPKKFSGGDGRLAGRGVGVAVVVDTVAVDSGVVRVALWRGSSSVCYGDAEKAKLLMELLKKRRKFFAAKRSEEKRNRPPKLFDKAMKRINTFVDFRTKLVEEGSKKDEVTEARFEKVRPVDNMDSFLLHNLKTMFTHPVEDNNILYDLLVEKMYPLTHHTLHQIFNDVKLQVDYEYEMAYELLRLVKKQLKEGYLPQ
nr:hypothetical protein [Tanacetum cinerariifolium]